MRKIVKPGAAAVMMAVLAAASAAPATINYRGRLLDSTGNVDDGSRDIVFGVYSDAVGGTLLYEDRNTAALGNAVTVSSGLYQATIGDDAGGGGTYTALAEALKADDSVYLQITIDGTALSPREQLRSVPFSLACQPQSLIRDDDGDTKVQVEEGVDDDTVRIDTAGVERVTVGPAGTMTVAGDLSVGGEIIDSDGATGISGQVLTADGAGKNLWSSNSASVIPYLSMSKVRMKSSTSKSFIVSGSNFTPSTSFSIPGFDGTVDAYTIQSPTGMSVTVTAGTTETSYDFVVGNGGVYNTSWSGNGEDLLEVVGSLWVDLRSGGAGLTAGNGAGNDIRYRSGMSMSRDVNGMYFTGNSPWSSWVKFEFLQWTRGTGQTLEWVFTRPSSAMMIGIGSTATNESSASQWAEAEVQAYFQSSTLMWGLYGNNGTPGAGGSQFYSTSIAGGTGVYKIRIEGDGDAGDQFTLYQLPSAAPADWDNTATVLAQFNIGGTLDPDESTIMPFIIPINGGTQRFVAVKVE